MGMGRFSTGDWAAYNARHVDGRSRSEVFGATGIDPQFDPARFPPARAATAPTIRNRPRLF